MTPSAIASALESTAFGAFAIWGVALAVIDVRSHRLPDRLVLPAYPVALGLWGSAALLRGEPAVLVTMVGGALALFVFYLALRMLRAGGLGGGDVKLAGVLGLVLGFHGWDAVLSGALAGFLLGGLYAFALIVSRRGTRRTAIAFGPWMLLGAGAVIFTTIDVATTTAATSLAG